MTSAAVIGAASWNELVELPRPLPLDSVDTVFANGSRTTLGGTGAGKAVNLAQLGFATRLQALLGDDMNGDRVRRALGAAGVEVHTWTDPAGTERHLNLMDPDGRRQSIYLSSSSPDPDLSGEDLAAFARDADYVFVSLAEYARRALAPLAADDVPIWVDLHDWDGQAEFHRDFADHGQYVFLSDERLDDPVGFARSLVRDKTLVVVTHAASGATAFLPEHEPLHVPAQRVEAPLDSNGAGDAFCAGVAFGRSRGWGWVDALRAGAYVAARSVASTGLSDPDLTPDQVAASVRPAGFRK
jgi:sugar/nucleoside kinase (ribokinase family)